MDILKNQYFPHNYYLALEYSTLNLTGIGIGIGYIFLYKKGFFANIF